MRTAISHPGAALLVAALALGACARGPSIDGTRPAPRPPAPVAVPAPAPQSDPAWFRTVIGDTVTFPANDGTLGPEARDRLARQAGWLKDNRGWRATIEGHADEQGTREYNLALGARRAGAVQEYMIAEGVEGGRLRTTTLGKERPLAVCSDEPCLARNRRAVTVLAPAGPGV